MARKPKPEIRPSRSTRRVLLVLLTGSPRLYGYSICRAAMVGSGTLYPLLERLEKATAMPAGRCGCQKNRRRRKGTGK